MPKKSPPQPAQEFITVREAATEAGVTVAAVSLWIKKGYLRARRRGAGISSPYLIYRASWEKFLRDREINTDLDEQ